MVFAHSNPDLVAFQEAIKSDDYDQVIDLLDAKFHVAHQTSREADGQGISIASRWPLGRVQEVDLNVTPRTADFACARIFDEPIEGVWASDHFGLVADLTVPPRSSAHLP